MLLKSLQHTGNTPPPTSIWPTILISLRLRNPDAWERGKIHIHLNALYLKKLISFNTIVSHNVNFNYSCFLLEKLRKSS